MQDTIRTYLECRRRLSWGPLRINLTQTEKDYLLCLGTYPGVKIGFSELGKIFSDSPATVSPTVNRLKKQGLVELARQGRTKTKRPLNLTETGRRAYEGLSRYLEQSIQYGFPIDATPTIDIGFLGII